MFKTSSVTIGCMRQETSWDGIVDSVSIDEIARLDGLRNKEYLVLEKGTYVDGRVYCAEVQCRGYIDEKVYVASQSFYAEDQEVLAWACLATPEQRIAIISGYLGRSGFQKVEEFTSISSARSSHEDRYSLEDIRSI